MVADRNRLKKVDRIMTLIASRILLAVFVFYIPYITISMSRSSLVRNTTRDKRPWIEFSLLFGYELAYCNSFSNAVIFLSFNKACREKVLNVFRKPLKVFQ